MPRPGIQGYLSAFQKSAGVPVTLMSIQQYYTSNVRAMVSTGVPPDVLYVSRTEYNILWPSNKLADLRPYLQRDSKLSAGYFPITLQVATQRPATGDAAGLSHVWHRLRQ